MDRIASFCVNHDILTKGMYISRCDGDITTFDIRFCLPNSGSYLRYACIHSIEHLMATILRNGPMSDKVVYFGPMGCRTGFYLLLRNTLPQDALTLTQKALTAASEWDKPLPGTDKIECGNYLEHDVSAAKSACREMAELLSRLTGADMVYKI